MRARQSARWNDQAHREQPAGLRHRGRCIACAVAANAEGGGMTLDGQIALVTGASRGIGKAIALELGRQGAMVAGTATTESGAQAIGAYLAAAQIKGAGFAMNVNDAAQVEATIATVQKQCGDIAI